MVILHVLKVSNDFTSLIYPFKKLKLFMYTLLFINLFTFLVTICPSVAFSDDIEHETNVEKGIIITLANTDKFILI